MSELPYRLIRIARDLSGVRAAIAEMLPPGQKMTFAKLASQRVDLGKRLMVAYAETLAPLAEAEFGEPATAMLPLGTVRHHTTQAAERAPWHFDGRFFKDVAGRGVTFWITLDDAGVAAPGLEFDVDGMIFAPVVPAGSALMFRPDVRHRTQPIDGERISFEFRCVPTTARPPEWQAAIQLTTETADDGLWVVVRRGCTVHRLARIHHETT